MAIYRRFREDGFRPAEIFYMSAAYELALHRLQVNRNDPITEIIAGKVIEVARSGQRDPAVICDAVQKYLSDTKLKP